MAYNPTNPAPPPPYSAFQNYPPADDQNKYAGYGVAAPTAYNAGYNQPHFQAGGPAGAYPPPQPAQAGHGHPGYEESYPPTRDDHHAQFGEFNAASFSDKAVRRAFIRKVYLILCSQLSVTVGFIAIFIFVYPVKKWVRTDGLWFYILAYCLFLVTYIALVCCPSVRRKSPGNFICLGVFTLAFSYMTATISSFHDTNIVLIAAAITAAVCLAVSIFAIQTKIDFTLCSGLLFVLLMVLVFFGLACIIVNFTLGYNRILDCVYAGLGALVFGLFLIYDTQMIMGGKKYELSPEEYIYGALQLYIDIVYIFLFLLSLMGKQN